MKKTTILFRALLVILTISTVLAFSACSELDPSLDNKDLRSYTETMLDAIISNDTDTAYSIVDDVCTKDNFLSIFSKMRDLIGDSEDYDLALMSVYYNSSSKNGTRVSTQDATYKMTTDNGTYIIYVQTSSEYEDLATFNLSRYENTNYYSVGSVKNMKGATPLQWILLLSNIFIIALGVWALVDCCRRPINRKWIFILLIIFGFISIGATYGPTGINFNLKFALISAYSALIRYGGGAVAIHFAIPVGAILYFILRKKITKNPEPSPETDNTATELPDTPTEVTDDAQTVNSSEEEKTSEESESSTN